jgi:hypothetical protein
MTALYGLPSLDLLTAGLLWGGAVYHTPNPQPGGPGLDICDPWRQRDQAIPPGTGYQF